MVVVAAALGLPGFAEATFPWSAIGHSRASWWESLAWASVLLLVLGMAASPRDRVARGLALAGLLTLAATILPPAKYEVNRVVPAEADAVATPVLGSSDAYRWTRATIAGNGVTRATDLVADEWLLMGIAGGIHETAGPSALRRALWGLHRGVVLGEIYGRVGVLLLTPWILWALRRDRAPKLIVGALLLLAWGPVVVNWATLAFVGAGMLPDDRDLWGSAAWPLLLQLGLLGLVSRVAR